jgi:hypothetical protein
MLHVHRPDVVCIGGEVPGIGEVIYNWDPPAPLEGTAAKGKKNFFSRPPGQISSMCDISSDGFLLPNGSILWSILVLWKVVGSWAVNNQPFNVIYIAAASGFPKT